MAIEPRTQAGRFLRELLRASVLGDDIESPDLLGWARGWPELVVTGLTLDAALALLVARRFPRGTDVRELHQYVAGVQAAWEPGDSFPARKIEMYLRARLGEPYLLAEVDPDQIGEPLLQLLIQLTQEVALSASDIDDLAVEAEGIAEQLARGRRVSTGTWEVLTVGAAELTGSSRVVDWSAIVRPETGGAPRSRPGKYVRALALLDKPAREPLAAQMRDTPEMITAITIMRALARDVLRAVFPAPVDLRQLTATLAHVRAGFRATHLALVDMDAVARADLGEDVFIDDIPVRVRHATRGAFVAATVQEVPLTADEVDALVAAAEQKVMPQS